MTCEEVRLELGAYVLGSLDEAAAAEVREHLDRCPRCRREAEAYGGVASALELVPPEAYGPTEAGAAGLDRVLARVAEERRRSGRQRVLLGVAAAAATAVLAGAGGVALGRGDAAPPPPPAASSRVAGRDTGTGVQAAVDVTQRGWGSALRLELDGVRGGQRCRLVAVSADGQREIAATWAVPSAGYSGEGLRVDGAVGLQPGVIQRFVVETLDGEPLVSVPLGTTS